MIAVSFSTSFLRYAIVEDGIINKVEKRRLSTNLSQEVIHLPENEASFKKEMDKLISEIEIPQNEIGFCFPSDWTIMETVSLDRDLSDEECKSLLEWHLSQKVPGYSDLFEHYFYALKSEDAEQASYLVVLLNRKIAEYLSDFCRRNSLKVFLADVGPFAALNALKQTGLSTDTSRVGLWKIMRKRNEITFFENGEFRHFMQFTLKNDGTFEVIKSSSPDPFALDVLEELTTLDDIDKEYVNSLDEVYIYTNHVDSEYFNTLLAYQLANVHVINPFEGLVVNEMDEQDGTGPGALCQYLELAGVIARYINGDY